ncbi:hypothetical protein DRO29_01180 [Candidatus Bathyarchaeota archaeon]|nr:MAG: hypothetical protein DRO29_01180 [Candidatus Bathyarchaeota archaeon]
MIVVDPKLKQKYERYAMEYHRLIAELLAYGVPVELFICDDPLLCDGKYRAIVVHAGKSIEYDALKEIERIAKANNHIIDEIDHRQYGIRIFLKEVKK